MKWYPAPGKLNLFLHVLGQREAGEHAGYHELQTVFRLVDRADRVGIGPREDGEVRFSGVYGDDNLCFRAAHLLKECTGATKGADISLEKVLPVGGGMGGGSSDAATCLLALNRLWGLKLPLATLERIGLALGADVPFFLRGHNAWVEGIGDIITPVELPPGCFAVVKPPEGLDTRDIFSAEDLHRATPPAIISGFAAHSESHQGQIERFNFGRNDLQPVAQRLCPAVTEAIEWLGHQGLEARMTGSGSSVFAAMPHDAELAEAPTGWQVRKCSNLAVHPLVGWAA